MSTPVVGSSSIRTLGRFTSAIAVWSRRCSPPERWRAWRVEEVGELHDLGHLLEPLGDARAGVPGQPGEQLQVLPHRHRRVDPGLLAGQADRLAGGRARARRCRAPSTRTRPASGVRSPAMIDTSVVLPAPFGPSSPHTSPASTLEADLVERRVVAVALAHALHLEHRLLPHAPSLAGGRCVGAPGELRRRCGRGRSRDHNGVMFTHIDHVGIAVPDLDEALAFYAEKFDLKSVHEEVNEEQGVREAMLAVGDSGSCIQLLAPLTPGLPIAKFLGKSGPGHPADGVPGRGHRRRSAPPCATAASASSTRCRRTAPPAPG